MGNYNDLLEALKNSDSLIKEAQGLLERHLYPDNAEDADETINHLLELLDGQKQRDIQKATRTAISEAEYVNVCLHCGVEFKLNEDYCSNNCEDNYHN